MPNISIPPYSLDYKSEDVVRDEAKELLGFKNDAKSKAGVGQLTSFKELDEYYFKNTKKKPDGWYFPHDTTEPAIILEAKSSRIKLDTQGGGNKKENEALAQLETYIKIAQQKYKKVVGILYNGEEAVIYKNNERIAQTNTLFNKNYYLSLFNKIEIDIDKIQTCTIRINEILHHKFVMQNLTQRMIFTACALVADRKGAKLESFKELSFSLLKQQIIRVL